MLSLQVRHESPKKPSPARNVVLANLTDSAALVVGTMAKNIMEGGAAIFGQLLQAQLQVLCNDGDVYQYLRPLKFLRKIRWQNSKNVSFALIHVVYVDHLIFL